MLNNLSKLKELSILESITLLSLFSTAYLVFYKISFFYQLKIEWYLALIPTEKILITGLPLISVGLLSFSLGAIISKFIVQFKSGFILEIVRFISLIMLIIFFIFIIENVDIKYQALVIFAVLNVISAINLMDNIKNIAEKLLVLFFMLSAALIGGAGEAKTILENREKILTEVDIKNEKAKWYILDIGSSGVLVIKEVQRDKIDKYKIIEMKEINEMRPPK